jgi:hypothetical protein
VQRGPARTLYSRSHGTYRASMNMLRFKRLAILTAAIGALLAAAPAPAQMGAVGSSPASGSGSVDTGADLRTPPKIEPTDNYRGMITLGVIALCALAVLGVSIIPSQRTHQD